MSEINGNAVRPCVAIQAGDIGQDRLRAGYIESAGRIEEIHLRIDVEEHGSS